MKYLFAEHCRSRPKMKTIKLLNYLIHMKK